MYNEAIWFCDYKRGEALDEYGDPVEERVLSDLVFAEKRSISQTEFWQSQTAGDMLEYRFVIPDELDYNKQAYLIHEGIRYKIKRAYKQEGTNILEITCYGGVRDVHAEVGDENN